jgi:hypothetical protein
MKLRLLDGAYAVCRLGPGAAAPAAPPSAGAFWSLTHTGHGERSLVCAADDAPAPDDGTVVEGGWRILEVAGPLHLGLTGVMAALSAPLARAKVPIFPIATHDTDWILVPGDRLEDAVGALRRAGHAVED